MPTERMIPPEDVERDARWLFRGAALVWLTTGLGVLHPAYRAVGERYLDLLGAPHWLMWLTCAFEVPFAIAVATLRPGVWLAALQVGLIAVFSVLLAVAEPLMLANPFGMITKNLPLCAGLISGALIMREGWSTRARWVLRAGVALIWITEGLFPRVLFQQAVEVGVVANSGLVPIDPSLFLTLMGVAQLTSGLATLVLRGRWLKVLLLGELVAAVVLPLMVGVQLTELWVHPFGPLTKNVPLLVGTVMLLRRW